MSGEPDGFSYSDEPECLEAIHALPTSPGAWLVPGEVGSYLLGEQIGEGGYGVVFRGRHQVTGRLAAVKLEHLPRLKPGVLTRFLGHARLAASIKAHPNLVALHDAGLDVDSGLAYLVMDLVEGPNLREWLRERGGPVPPRVAARIGLAVAEALVALQDSGIAHRDIKPSNILLAPGDPNDADGFPFVPRVADYGLARRDPVEGEATRTVSIAPSGTPAYIPPERLHNPECDPKPGDIYALGVLMYELTTGNRPFQGSSDFETQGLALAGNFADPRRYVPGIPRGLVRVVVGAMTRQPADRYPSPEDLRDDLKRFLEGRKVWGPKRTVWRGLTASLRRRRRTLVAAGTVGLGAILALGAARAVRDRQWAIRSRQARSVYADHVAAAGLRWADCDLDAARAELGRAAAVEGAGDPREVFWFALERATRPLRPFREVQAHAKAIYAVTESPDGRLLATGGDDCVIRLWPLRGDGPPIELVGHTKSISETCFSPDGTRLASVADDATFRLWSLPDGKQLAVASVRWSGSKKNTIAFSHDGRQFAVAGEAGAITREIRGLAAAYSPDGRLIATGGDDRAVRLWDGRDGSPRGELLAVNSSTQALVFLRDGRLISGHQDGTLRTWEPNSLRSTSVRRPGSGAIDHFVPLNGPGDRLLITGTEPSVGIWSLNDRPMCETVPVSWDGVRSAVLSPDGSTIAVIDKRGMVQLIAFDGVPAGAFRASTKKGTVARFLSDGDTVVTADVGGKLAFWRWRDALLFTPGGRPPRPDPPAAVTLSWAADALTVSRPGHEPIVIRGVPAGAKAAWLGPESLALFHSGDRSGLWNLDGRHLVRTTPGADHRGASLVGTRGPLFWQDRDDLIGIYDPATGARVDEVRDPGASWFRASRDGRFLAVAGSDEVRVWKLAPLSLHWRRPLAGRRLTNILISDNCQYVEVIEELPKFQPGITIWDKAADRAILALGPLHWRVRPFGLGLPSRSGDPITVWSDDQSPGDMVPIPLTPEDTPPAPEPPPVPDPTTSGP